MIFKYLLSNSKKRIYLINRNKLCYIDVWLLFLKYLNLFSLIDSEWKNCRERIDESERLRKFVKIGFSNIYYIIREWVVKWMKKWIYLIKVVRVDAFHYSDFNIMLKKGAQNESSDTWLAYINIQDMSLTFTYINSILYIKKYIIILRVSILLDALV